jgi:hypothetical protein
MSRHFFRITNCDGGTIEHPAEILEGHSAGTETAMVFVDLSRSCQRLLKENAEWRLELLGSQKEPLYRIRLIAETCEAVASTACLTADPGAAS